MPGAQAQALATPRSMIRAGGGVAIWEEFRRDRAPQVEDGSR